MKTNIILFIIMILSFKMTSGQNYQSGKLWVSVTSDDGRTSEEGFSRNSALNDIFMDFNVYSYFQVMGFAKTISLRDIYEIDCQCDELALKTTLQEKSNELFSFIEQIPVNISVYEPEDEFWKYNQNWIWHLTKIQADSTWDITIGNPQIKIGIVDESVDIEHPDLESQIYPHSDPYSGYEYNSLYLFERGFEHGTVVASFASAKTAETGTIPNPNGKLASIGFNTKMVGYFTSGIERVLHASTVMGVDVVNCSWLTSGLPLPGLDSTYRKVIKEVLNNGTIIVGAAGNGFCGSWYNDDKFWRYCDSIPPDFQYFSAPYPFNPKYDSAIILVTSTDSNDNHTLYGDTVVNRTHSHFPEVDICSPGHMLIGATLTYHVDTITGDTVKKDWPYYGSFSGTSFAAPIVSGVCALIKSINPCLTPAQIEEIIKYTADPVTDASFYPGKVGAGRINAYHAVKYAQENYGYEEFTIGNGQDITWTNDIQAKKINIEWGGKLTIKSTIYMLPESDIIVNKGGKLVVDGGHITTCKGLFNGIQVRGRVDLDQYGYFNQGHLSLINGAIIENAKTGVQLIKIDTSGVDQYSTGGIIQAVQASFLNCVTSVAFYPYENFLNDKRNIKDNLSYINNCTFKLDTNYHHVFNNPKQFIFMESVRGISIKGCSFLNEIKSKDYEAETLIDPDKMVGITSLNSSFKIDEYCLNLSIPCDSTFSSRFENLNYGIYASHFGGEKFPVINKTDFINNKTGAYLGSINNAVITSNYFYSKAVDTIGLYPYIIGGLYMDYCNAYLIEENIFAADNGPMASVGSKVGLVINNSGPYANEVYKNDFLYLDYGVIAMNENKRDSVGLCIKCNDFTNCRNDISVVIEGNVTGWGIAEYQGSRDSVPSAPAGNIFTSNYANHNFDLYNDDDADPFTYFHHNEIYLLTPNVKPDFYSPSVSLSLNNEDYDPEESCPSHLGIEGSLSSEKSSICNSENQVFSIEESLASLIDGGSTPSLSITLETSNASEALEISEQLHIESPYLSDTVLKIAIEKEEVLTNAMIRDVLVENPQSAKSAVIMNMINERIEPMPDYMMHQIAQGKFTTGNMEDLEAYLSYYISKQTFAFNNLNRIYQSDSTFINRLDSLLNLFDVINTIQIQYRKVFIYLENGDTAQVSGIMNAIPTDFSLTVQESITHQKYMKLLDAITKLKVSNGSIMKLDSTQIADLLDIYDNETQPGIYARNVLVSAGYLTYHEPYLFPDNLKRIEILEDSHSQAEKEIINLKVFPNPANYYTIVEFDFQKDDFIQLDNIQVLIKVRDAHGSTVKTLKSNQQKDQLILDIRNLKPGLYYLDLFANGQRYNTVKMIVNR